MNERIKAIGRQAGFGFIEDGVYGQRWYSSKCGMDASEFEKFAQLIILECAEVAFNDWCDGTNEGSSQMTSLKHFGVEE
jgi:hypothetical protein